MFGPRITQTLKNGPIWKLGSPDGVSRGENESLRDGLLKLEHIFESDRK